MPREHGRKSLDDPVDPLPLGEPSDGEQDSLAGQAIVRTQRRVVRPRMEPIEIDAIGNQLDLTRLDAVAFGQGQLAEAADRNDGVGKAKMGIAQRLSDRDIGGVDGHLFAVDVEDNLAPEQKTTGRDQPAAVDQLADHDHLDALTADDLRHAPEDAQQQGQILTPEQPQGP